METIKHLLNDSLKLPASIIDVNNSLDEPFLGNFFYYIGRNKSKKKEITNKLPDLDKESYELFLNSDWNAIKTMSVSDHLLYKQLSQKKFATYFNLFKKLNIFRRALTWDELNTTLFNLRDNISDIWSITRTELFPVDLTLTLLDLLKKFSINNVINALNSIQQ